MEFTIDFPTGGPADIDMTVSGLPSVAELELFNEALVSDPRFRAGMTMLVDVAGLEYDGITQEELQEMSVPMLMRDWKYPSAAVAIVTPGGRTHDHLLRYRAHVGGSKSNRAVFDSREEAIAWLEERKSA